MNNLSQKEKEALIWRIGQLHAVINALESILNQSQNNYNIADIDLLNNTIDIGKEDNAGLQRIEMPPDMNKNIIISLIDDLQLCISGHQRKLNKLNNL